MHNKYVRRLRYVYSSVRFEINAYLYSLIGLIKSRLFIKNTNINKLEIGIGNSPRKSGFITSDLNLKTDFPFDLRIGLPFKDESIDFIYSEHVLEHFNHKDLIYLLADCCRVIKNKGIFSASVPNAKIYLEAYHSPDKFDIKKYCTYDFGLSYKSKIDFVNYIFYMDGHHRHMFEPDNLLILLKNAGFVNVRIREYDSNLDSPNRLYESIYVEATKE